jgi:crotonobetainyl-CoA:carnitine CoA-transferase CaiB-like acyl-CoA transferase
VLADAGVPAAEVRDLGNVLANEQVAALSSIEYLSHELAGDTVAVAPSPRVDQAPLGYRRAAPVLGADTAAVLSELGLSEQEIAGLVLEGTAVTA